MSQLEMAAMMTQIERLSNLLEDERNRVAEHSNQLAFLQAASLCDASPQRSTHQGDEVPAQGSSAPNSSIDYFVESPYGDVYSTLLQRLGQGESASEASIPLGSLFGGSKGAVIMGLTADDITRIVWRAARIGYAALVAAVRGAFFFIGPVYFTFKILFFDLFGESLIVTSAKRGVIARAGGVPAKGNGGAGTVVVRGASPVWSLLRRPTEEEPAKPLWRKVLEMLFGGSRLVVEPRDAFSETFNGEGTLRALREAVVLESREKELTMGDLHDLGVLLAFQPSPP